MKHKEKHRVLEERFQKVGESKKLPSNFLEGKARRLWEQGKGKWSNQSRSLTKEEEEVLW